jgi:hypothetical protein
MRMVAWSLLFLIHSVNATDFRNQIEAYSMALEEGRSSKKAWECYLIRVRTILDFRLEIPFISSFSINPEVELHFVKGP